MSDITRILSRIDGGDLVAVNELLPLVYDELRQMAAAQMARERPGQTLQTTALVHEAFLKMMGGESTVSFSNRRHFFGAAAEAMRRILVDQARRKQRKKHGGGMQRVELDAPQAPENSAHDELLALDAALPRLAEEDPMAAEVVQLKYFAGLSREEIAETLGHTVHEVRRKWDYARAWLRLAIDS